MKISNRRIRQALLGAAVASTTLISACGGGGGSDAATTTAQSASVPTAKFACRNVVGAVDPVQGALIVSLVPQLASIPQAGPTVQRLVFALAQLLDVVDVVTNGLQAMAQSRDPMQLNSTVESAVASLRCALTNVDVGVVGIDAMLPAGTSIPAIGNADALMAQIAALLDAKLGAGPGAGLPTGLDLAVLTGLMQQLNVQLNAVASQLTAKLPAGTPVAPVFSMINVSLVDVTLVFDRIAALDDAGVADALTFVIRDVQVRMTSTLATTLGVPADQILGPHNQLTTALTTISLQLAGPTAIVMTQLHSVLLTLLGSLLGLLG